uniref:HAT C-terminal dimerisation domain-containing protein n=1 Tax=Lactuca sativa TaxID=4236 RepID=A0A9R1W1U2_LACSA|nr:hypothetical protein LSAT_V11C300141460 [Lactuca sativa]
MHGFDNMCAHMDREISQERMKCFLRLFPNDDEYSKVLDEYAMFSMKSHPFEDLKNISKMATMEPKNWWVNFGLKLLFSRIWLLDYLENLVLLLVLSLTTSHAQDFVYIHNNLRILSRNSNNDVKMWDVGGDVFDSMEDLGFLEVVDLSLDEPDFENDLIIDN